MSKYVVTVSRTSWCEFEVEAENASEAYGKALAEASNHSWASEDAEYSVQDINEDSEE